jgi:hypothetical protein
VGYITGKEDVMMTGKQRVIALVGRFYRGWHGKLPKGEFSRAIRIALARTYNLHKYDDLEDQLYHERIVSEVASHFGKHGALAKAMAAEMERLTAELEAEERAEERAKQAEAERCVDVRGASG